MLNSFESYLYGLILTDGSLYFNTRNRGRITIELNKKDDELLYKLQQQIPNSTVTPRIRDTNFKQHSETTMFTNYRREFREFFVTNGIPKRDKSIYGTIPNTPYSESDFWRGVYDGNGSVGFTANLEPFISLVTKSEPLKTELLSLLRTKFGIIKNLNPNGRDHVYNIVLKNEDAVEFTKFTYQNASIYMKRKHDEYTKIQKWIRTKPKLSQTSWSNDEIEYIQTHTIEESMNHLQRTKSSIRMKLWRLMQK